MIKKHYDYLVLLFSIIVSAILRILVPYGMVFQNGKVIYNAADAYYHMRYVDLLVANYPQFQFADPYLQNTLGIAPLWDLLIVWLGKNVGVDLIAAYLPVILGVLTLLGIFVITKEVFKDKLIASVAVGLGAIISGLFFARTQLGAADHHALEIFLLTGIMGISIEYLVNKKDTAHKIDYMALIVILAVAYYFTWGIPSLIYLGIFILAFYLWLMLKLYGVHKKWFTGLLYVPIVVIGIVLVSHAGYLGYFGQLIRYAVPLSFGLSVAEEWPLFFSYSSAQDVFLDLSTIWGYFGLLFFTTLVGIGMLAYRVIKHKHGQDILLLSWTIIIFVLTLFMRRWAYYLAVNVVILSSFSIVVIVRSLVAFKGKVNMRLVYFACLIGLFFIVIPFIRNDVGIARNEQNYPTKGWQEAASFLRSQLTESQNAEYYKVWEDGDTITTPYVLSWWDYGYYLVRESHMLVLSHGGGMGHKQTAKLLLSEDVDIVEQLKALNIKYIVIDNKMAIEYFYAIANLAGQDIGKYYFNNPGNIELTRTQKYYDTLLSRLYLFNDIKGIDIVYASGNLVLAPGEVWTSEVKVFEVE